MLTKQEGRPRPVILSAAKELWHRCANRRGTEILRGAQDDRGALDPHMLSTSIIASLQSCSLVYPAKCIFRGAIYGPETRGSVARNVQHISFSFLVDLCRVVAPGFCL